MRKCDILEDYYGFNLARRGEDLKQRSTFCFCSWFLDDSASFTSIDPFSPDNTPQ